MYLSTILNRISLFPKYRAKHVFLKIPIAHYFFRIGIRNPLLKFHPVFLVLTTSTPTLVCLLLKSTLTYPFPKTLFFFSTHLPGPLHIQSHDHVKPIKQTSHTYVHHLRENSESAPNKAGDHN